jgi:hypothetical protein
MRRLLLLASALAAAGCSSGPDTPPPKPLPLEQQPVRARPLDGAIADGVAFLLKSQEKGGYWGTGCRPLGWDIYASPPASHRAFQVGTTGLCARALRETGTPEALAAAIRAEDWLATKALRTRRATRDEIYNVWGHTYALQALALAIREEKDATRLEVLRRGAKEHLDWLDTYETIWGGWNYYDFAIGARNPSMEPTAFGTAAGLIAMKEAQDAGIEIPEPLRRLAVRVVEKCRTPENTYLYSLDWRYYPMGLINRPAGSLGRTQACNDALYEWGSKDVGMEDLVGGLERLFKEQRWLECGRKRPYPHEAYYAVAGYFYYFGHYYAARLLSFVEPVRRREFAQKMSDLIRPKQEEDGSWWDFGMWDFHKPYGTAFALMILRRCREAGAE